MSYILLGNVIPKYKSEGQGDWSSQRGDTSEIVLFNWPQSKVIHWLRRPFLRSLINCIYWFLQPLGFGLVLSSSSLSCIFISTKCGPIKSPQLSTKYNLRTRGRKCKHRSAVRLKLVKLPCRAGHCSNREKWPKMPGMFQAQSSGSGMWQLPDKKNNWGKTLTLTKFYSMKER